MSRIAKVAVEKAATSFDKLYSYMVPAKLCEELRPGCRVIVPFGGGNRRRQGLVTEVLEEESDKPLKEIAALIDSEPLLTDELLSLMQLLKRRTFCTYYDTLKVLIPAGISVRVKTICALGKIDASPQNPDEENILAYLRQKKKPIPLESLQTDLTLPANSPALQSLVDREAVILAENIRSKSADGKIMMAKLSVPAEGEETSTENFTGTQAQKLSPGQRGVLDLLSDGTCASVKELCYFAGVTMAVVKNLEKKGLIELFGRQIFRNPYSHEESAPKKDSPQKLTPSQDKAFKELLEIYKGRDSETTALLYGVTGSGKTQVFLRLIQEVRQAEDKGVIVLVPEISLTPQTVEVFKEQFGDKVAVLHSGLTMVERADEYKRIRQGLATVVVGTRSAVFAPLSNIGLIVMDEEQERTYRSEQTPKFHAREVARLRCRWHKAMLLLASATPSVESFYHAKRGKYHLVRLTQRYMGRELPQVELVDMSQEYESDISPRLAEEIVRNIRNKEQIILLMNRRGYNTLVKCGTCKEVASCPNCSVALTYHSANGRLLCHYCGYSQPVADPCKICGGSMNQYRGSGTQRIEELLGKTFPNAAVLRMDMDTTMARFAHEKKFSAFADGDYQIMVGTQMVAKGLNFPNVTLVGVLNADQSLYAQDFRSCEKTFNLITQVVGRCGRGELPGRAIVQTTTPDHPVIRQAARQDYESFYTDEIKSRKLGLYPPFCTLCLASFSGENQAKVKEATQKFSDHFRGAAQRDYKTLPIRMLEPCEPLVEKVAGRHRYNLVIKCRQSEAFCKLMWEALAWFDSDPIGKAVSVSIDMTPD